MEALSRTGHARAGIAGNAAPGGGRVLRAAPGRRSGPRVLILTVGFTVGGAEQLILMTAPRLRRDGFEVTVACLKEWGPVGDELQAAGVRALALGARSPIDPRAAGRLISLLRRERIQIVHAHLFLANLVARVLGRLSGDPVVITTHHDTDLWMGSRHRLLERVTAPLSDAVVTCSEAVRQYALATYRLRPGLVQTLRNAIVIPERPAGAATRERVRALLCAGPEDRLIATVGRLDEPKKGLAVFLRAAGRLARLMQDNGSHGAPAQARFVLVGDGPARPRLETLAREEGIDHLTTFMGERRDVRELMEGFDLFVQPSLWEGFGVTLLEAMASGLPIVASRVGGIPEIVRDGETGLLVPPGDAGALAEECLRLLHHPDLAARMGEAGRTRLEEQFGIDRLVGETARLYRDLLARRRGEAAAGGAGPHGGEHA
jgi:glycosyltransferase involved in cell wall biosynthesis